MMNLFLISKSKRTMTTGRTWRNNKFKLIIFNFIKWVDFKVTKEREVSKKREEENPLE